MSKNIWYRILAVIGAAMLLAFAVMLSLVFATGKQVFIYLAGGMGGIGLIIWLGLTIIKKNMEKREELDKQFAEFEKNKNNSDTEQACAADKSAEIGTADITEVKKDGKSVTVTEAGKKEV